MNKNANPDLSLSIPKWIGFGAVSMLEYSADGAKQLENPEEGIHGFLKRGVLEVTLDPLFGSISGIWTFLRKPTSKNLRETEAKQSQDHVWFGQTRFDSIITRMKDFFKLGIWFQISVTSFLILGVGISGHMNAKATIASFSSEQNARPSQWIRNSFFVVLETRTASAFLIIWPRIVGRVNSFFWIFDFQIQLLK